MVDDLNKLINKQKVGYILYSSKIPISKNLNNFLKRNNKNILEFISKGDDYQILFTSPKSKRKYIKSLSKRINIKITQIGNTTNVKNQRTVIDGKNHLKSINYRGYSHKF